MDFMCHDFPGPNTYSRPRPGPGKRRATRACYRQQRLAPTASVSRSKAAITGTYRAISSKHVPRYLAEFEYRFNRRYDLAAMIPRLCWAGVRTAPMPYQPLKLAEVHA